MCDLSLGKGICPHGLVVAAAAAAVCLLYLHDIFLFSFLITCAALCCEVGVLELAPSQRLDQALYQQVILPLSLTHLELFKCHFQLSPAQVERTRTHTHTGFTVKYYRMGIFFFKVYNYICQQDIYSCRETCRMSAPFYQWYNMY